MTVTLEVTKRTAGEKPDGSVPGVVYGPKQESVPIAIDKRVFDKTLDEAGESTIITLTGLDEEMEVLIHDVAFNAARGGVEHVDFYAIERGKELTTNVALEFVGDAPAEKDGLILNKILYDVQVTCRPSVLPSHIDVDLSGLVEVTSQITVADLTVEEGVQIDNDPEEVIASVSEARADEPEEPVEDVDMDAVEVEEKGKTDDGEAATDDAGADDADTSA